MNKKFEDAVRDAMNRAAQPNALDMINDAQLMTGALMAALYRQPGIDAAKLQLDFLELCEVLYGSPSKVPKLARAMGTLATAAAQPRP